MRLVGYSTGAVSKGDFAAAIALLSERGIRAVELSALRMHELRPLMAALTQLDLSEFQHVSVHAPSDFADEAEQEIVDLLQVAADCGHPIVVHPDAIRDWTLWRALGEHVLIENMDKRKPIGRTRDELAECFAQLPKARLCFDVGHARQVDPAMLEARRILSSFGDRLGQVHISEVGSDSKHERISLPAARTFRAVAGLIPLDIAVIIESAVTPDQLIDEMARARSALGEGVFPRLASATASAHAA